MEHELEKGTNKLNNIRKFKGLIRFWRLITVFSSARNIHHLTQNKLIFRKCIGQTGMEHFLVQVFLGSNCFFFPRIFCQLLHSTHYPGNNTNSSSHIGPKSCVHRETLTLVCKQMHLPFLQFKCDSSRLTVICFQCEGVFSLSQKLSQQLSLKNLLMLLPHPLKIQRHRQESQEGHM